MANFKGGIIGINGIGKEHGKMMVGSDAIDVIAIADTNPAMKATADEHFPGAAFYTDVAAMLAAQDLDVVAIAIPHSLHAPVAIQCLRAGVGVIVEKPMATTYDDCCRMIDAAEASGAFLTVYHNRRLDPWFLTAKQIMDEGAVGRVYEMNTAIGYAGRSPTWRGNKKASGGVMYDWGAHLVDYCLHFDPSPVKSVSGWLYSRPGADPDLNEDHGALRIYFTSGAVANVTVSALDGERPYRYRILGESGSLTDTWRFDDKSAIDVVRHYEGKRYTTTYPYHPHDRLAYYRNIVAHLRGEAELAVSAESAARVINVLCTAERSSLDGGIPLPLQ